MTDRRNLGPPRPELEARAAEFRRRLEASGLSGRDLARLRGQAEETISHWATARRRVPQEAFAFLDLWDRLGWRDRNELLPRPTRRRPARASA